MKTVLIILGIALVGVLAFILIKRSRMSAEEKAERDLLAKAKAYQAKNGGSLDDALKAVAKTACQGVAASYGMPPNVTGGFCSAIASLGIAGLKYAGKEALAAAEAIGSEIAKGAKALEGAVVSGAKTIASGVASAATAVANEIDGPGIDWTKLTDSQLQSYVNAVTSTPPNSPIYVIRRTQAQQAQAEINYRKQNNLTDGRKPINATAQSATAARQILGIVTGNPPAVSSQSVANTVTSTLAAISKPMSPAVSVAKPAIAPPTTAVPVSAPTTIARSGKAHF